MTNILFLLSHTEKGGGEVVIYNLLKNLNRTQFRPFLGHVDFRKGTFIHEFKKLGVEPVDFRASHLRNLPATLAVILRLRRFIRNNSIDVVFTSGAHNHIYASLAKRLTSIPVVTYIMNYYQPRLKDNPMIMRLALSLGADFYVLNTFMGLESIKKLIPARIPSKVVYHGIDKDFINAEDKGASIRGRLGLSNKNKLISVVARLQCWKGQDIFLRAASLIAQSHPDARFCLVGGALFGMDEDYPDELRRLIDELGLTGRCWLVGHQENSRDWISASDIVVHPLRIPDAGAVVLREAMFLGKPVVATSYGATLEFIKDSVSGILCQPNSPEDLADKITKLLDKVDLADKIVKTARDIAFNRFTAEGMAREVEDVLKQVSGSKSAQKKRILITLCVLKKGGQEVAMRNVMKVIDSGIFEPIVALLYPGEKPVFTEEIQKSGVEVITRHIGRLRNPINVFRTVYWLGNLIKEKNVKLVFCAGGTAHPYSRIAALITNTPIVAYETFIFGEYFWQKGPISALNFLLGSDAYVSSGKLAAKTLYRASLWKRPIHYLPHMVDLDIFDFRKSGAHLRRQLNIPLDAFVFSMVARIQRGKGQDKFVEAAIQVLGDAPDTYFLIFGEPTFDNDIAYLDSLRKKVASYGFTGRIIFAGFLQDSSYAYAASDVICHCSDSPEAFGLDIIEAFAMKKPVIATVTGGEPESVEPGEDGWLVPAGSARKLALAMGQCLKERGRLSAMGERGYQKAREVYSQQQFASAINSIIMKYAH